MNTGKHAEAIRPEIPVASQPRKPIASLSLDLDNKWSYMKTNGTPGWESFPSYLDVLVPRVLNFLEARDLTITFFVVGQDAALDKHHEGLYAISAAGHEIGNHSFKHDPWLHLYSKNEIDTEVASAEEHIERASGQRPVGFRAPGYSLTGAVLRVLAGRRYQYDASTLPNLMAPLARGYYFMAANFNAEEKKRRRVLGGRFRDGLRPIRAYRWRINDGSEMLIEIPVTTMPIFRLPIHVSYLICLSVFSRTCALNYFNTALKLCRFTGTQPSLLLHPTDFLGGDEIGDFPFIPGISLPAEKKLEFVSDVISSFSEQFTVLTLQQHAVQFSDLPVIEPHFLIADPEQQPLQTMSHNGKWRV